MINIPHIVTLLQNQKQPVPELIFPSTSTYTHASEYSDVYDYYIKTMRSRTLSKEEYTFVLDFHKYWIKQSSTPLREYTLRVCNHCNSEVYVSKNNKAIKDDKFYCSRECTLRQGDNKIIKYVHDVAYFEGDLNEIKGYDLGYIFSMSSIVGNTRPALYVYNPDQSKLEYIRGFLKSNVEISGYIDNSFALSPDKCFKMVFNGTILVNSLYDYGLNVMDMFIQDIPEISPHLYSSFISGFLDGCDSVSYNNDKSSNTVDYLVNKGYMIFSREMYRWIRDYLVSDDNRDFVCSYFNIVEYENISVIEEYIDRRFYMRVLIN